MGISAEQYWNTSKNGKSMTLMLAQRDNVEPVRDICDWLVTTYRKDLIAGAMQRGANKTQAEKVGDNGSAELFGMVESISDANCTSVATIVIDRCFQRFYNAGKPKYDEAMAWFADQLRARLKNDDEH